MFYIIISMEFSMKKLLILTFIVLMFVTPKAFSASGYSNAGKGYSSEGKGYNNGKNVNIKYTNSKDISPEQLQLINQMQKDGQKWLDEHPQEAEQMKKYIETQYIQQ